MSLNLFGVLQKEKQRSRYKDNVNRTNKTHVLVQICKFKRNHPPNHDELSRWSSLCDLQSQRLFVFKNQPQVFIHFKRRPTSDFPLTQSLFCVRTQSGSLKMLSDYFFSSVWIVQIFFIWLIDWMVNERWVVRLNKHCGFA